MWRLSRLPLRPSVKGALRRLQDGEVDNIVVPTKWELYEVHRRMTRFYAGQKRPELDNEANDGPVAHPRFQQKSRGASDKANLSSSPDPSRSVDTRARVPKALEHLPKTNLKGEVLPGRVEVATDTIRITELLEFVLWVVGEFGIVDVSELTEFICYQFGLGTFSDQEIVAVLEVSITEEKGAQVELGRESQAG